MKYELNLEPFTWVYVVGESFHIPAITSLKLFTEKQLKDEASIETTFDIVPEPDNPYSASGMALSVRKNGKLLGYLGEDTEQNVRDALARIAASGMTASTTGTLWMSKTSEGVRASIKIRLPRKFDPATLEGDGLVPVAAKYAVPNAYQARPEDSKATKTREPVTQAQALRVLKIVAQILLVMVVGLIVEAITGSKSSAGFVFIIGALWIIFGRRIRTKFFKK